jgi:hypothetical protein
VPDMTKESRRGAGSPPTTNRGVSNTTRARKSPFLSSQVPSDSTAWEAPDKLRILHADVDSLVVTANFKVRLPIRRDLQRARAMQARAEGKEAAATDVDTGEALPLDWDELALVGADAWEASRSSQVAAPGSSTVPTTFVIAGMTFRIESYPFGGYQWFLRGEHCDVWLNPEKQPMRPTAKVRVSPELIASVGALAAWHRVRAVFQAIAVYGDTAAGGVVEAKVQRIDIKCDFLGGAWIGYREVMRRAVTRAVLDDWHRMPYGARNLSKKALTERIVDSDEGDVEIAGHGRRRHDTGWTLGSKANIEIGVYDKTVEIGKKQGIAPSWQRAVWNAGGRLTPDEALDPSSASEHHIWRIEARFNSEALRAFKVRMKKDEPRRELGTPDDVIGCVADLWRYFSQGWFRVINRTSTRLERCETNAVWRAIAEWPLGHGPAGSATFATAPHVELTRDAAGTGKAAQAVSQFFGQLGSFLSVAGPAEAMALAKRVMPDATALHSASFIAAQLVGKFAKKKAVATVADRMYGDAIKKEAALSVTAGMRPSRELQRMIYTAAASVTDADADRVLYEKIASAQKERNRRKKRHLEAIFEGVDLSNPVHRGAYDKVVRQQEEDDREIRNMFDAVARELLGLDESVDVTEELLGVRRDTA